MMCLPPSEPRQTRRNVSQFSSCRSYKHNKMSLILFTTESQMDLFGALGFNTGDELDEHSRREVYQHYISNVKRNEIPWPEKSTHIYGLQVLYRGTPNTGIYLNYFLLESRPHCVGYCFWSDLEGYRWLF